MDDMDQMKVCRSCHQEKKYSEFYRNNRQDDGFDYYCKICKKQKNREWIANNKDKYNASKRKYERRQALDVLKVIEKKKREIARLLRQIKELREQNK